MPASRHSPIRNPLALTRVPKDTALSSTSLPSLLHRATVVKWTRLPAWSELGRHYEHSGCFVPSRHGGPLELSLRRARASRSHRYGVLQSACPEPEVDLGLGCENISRILCSVFAGFEIDQAAIQRHGDEARPPANILLAASGESRCYEPAPRTWAACDAGRSAARPEQYDGSGEGGCENALCRSIRGTLPPPLVNCLKHRHYLHPGQGHPHPKRLNRAMKTPDDVIAQLRRVQPDLRRRYPIREIGIYGSYVRGEQTEDSDLTSSWT